jgi:1-deoxy-D-xylulose-5-phosphate synthase
MRIFPNVTVMAPGDEADLQAMLPLALAHDGPVSIRYPKAKAIRVERAVAAVERGKAEVIEWGDDGMIVACGALLAECVRAAQLLRSEGLDVGVVNARFVKPLDTDVLLRVVSACGAVVTVEEAALAGGFGSAVLEAANAAGLDTSRIRCLGIGDQFVEHGERDELLASLGLDAAGIAEALRSMLGERHELQRERLDDAFATRVDTRHRT